MSGYLGYDAERVDMLRQAMGRADDELAAIRCADVDARSAMVAVASARSALADFWMPFLHSLSQCRALDGYVPAGIDSGDLINSWLGGVAAQRGWRVATDPLPGSAGPAFEAMTVEAARALGEALSGTAGEETLSAAELAWLQGRLAEIAGRPELVAVFLPAFTTVGWTNLCNQLGTRRQRAITEAVVYNRSITAAEHDEWIRVDAVFASLGAILTCNSEVHPQSDATSLLADMTPYAAALLVDQLVLDAETLGAVARDLIDRERIDLLYAEETNVGPRAADILLEKVIATAGAATRYVLLTLDDPGLVLDVAFAPEIGNAVMTAGIDPGSMNAHDAAVAVPTLVRWIIGVSTSTRYMSYNWDLPIAAADLLAPYLLPVLRPDDDGYEMSADDRRAIQLFVIDDARAFEHLLAARERISSTLGSAVGDQGASVTQRISVLRDLAGVLAIIDTMARAGSIRTAERALAAWELMWTALDYASTAVSFVPAVVPQAIGPAVSFLHDAADLAGWGPASINSVRAASLNRLDVVTTVAAATVVCASFDSMVAAGRIPPNTQLPPVPDVDDDHVGNHYSEAFADWVGELDPAVAYELTTIKQTIASDHEAEANANGELLGT